MNGAALLIRGGGTLLGLLSFGAPAAAAAISACVGIPPMEYFVGRVGGQYVEVRSLTGPGQSPHVFEPTPKQMAWLAGARVYFSLDFPFENRLAGKLVSLNPRLLVVDAARGVRRRAMIEPDTDAHGAETDPHVWLNPKNAAVIAENIRDALSRLDPPHAAEFGRNAASLVEDLARLDRELARTLAPFRGGEFFVYHAAFGYFGDAYGMRQVPVETAGKEPGAKALAALVARARAAGVRVIFVQRQFSSKSAREVARAIGGAVIPLDDLDRDYMNNMQEIASKIRDAMAEAARATP